MSGWLECLVGRAARRLVSYPYVVIVLLCRKAFISSTPAVSVNSLVDAHICKLRDKNQPLVGRVHSTFLVEGTGRRATQVRPTPIA